MEFDGKIFRAAFNEAIKGRHGKYIFKTQAREVIDSLVKSYNTNQKRKNKLPIQEVRNNALNGIVSNTNHRQAYNWLMIIYMKKIRHGINA